MKNKICLSDLKKSSLAIVIPLLLIAFSTNITFAQKTWIGSSGVSGSWNDANNWTPNGAPDASTNVTIPAGANIAVSSACKCANITFQGAAQINIPIDTDLEVSGDVNYVTSGTQRITVDGGPLTVRGDVNIASPNNNIIDVRGAGKALFYGKFSNAGGGSNERSLLIDGDHNATGNGNTTIGWMGDNDYIRNMNYDNLKISLPADATQDRVRKLIDFDFHARKVNVQSLSNNFKVSLDIGGDDATFKETLTVGKNAIFKDSGTPKTQTFEKIEVLESGKFILSKVDEVNLRNGISNKGEFDMHGTGTVYFRGNLVTNVPPHQQYITGTHEINFHTVNVHLSLGMSKVVNQISAGRGFILDGWLDAAYNPSVVKFINEGVFTYGSKESPMITTGTKRFKANAVGNVVHFTTDGDLKIPETNFVTLKISGNGTKFLVQKDTTKISDSLVVEDGAVFKCYNVAGGPFDIHQMVVGGTAEVSGTINVGSSYVEFKGGLDLSGGTISDDRLWNPATTHHPNTVIIQGAPLVFDGTATFREIDDLTIGQQIVINNGDQLIIDNSNTTFKGNLLVEQGGTYNETGNNKEVAEIHFTNGIENNGNFVTSNNANYFFDENQNIRGTSKMVFNSKNVTIANNKAVRNSNPSVTIKGNLVGENTNSTWVNEAKSKLILEGDVFSGGTQGKLNATAVDNTVVYNDHNAQTIIGTDYYNLTVSNTGIKTLSAGTNIAGDLVVEAGATLECGGNPIVIQGNIINNGKIRGCDVEFKGGKNQTISGTGDTDFGKLTTTYPGTTLTLKQDINVHDVIKMSSKIFVADNDLILEDDAKFTTPLDATHHVVTGGEGHVCRKEAVLSLSNPFVFPVGDGKNYSPFFVTPPFTSVCVKVTNAIWKGIDANSSDYISRYWDVESSGGNFDIQAQYVPGDVKGNKLSEACFNDGVLKIDDRITPPAIIDIASIPPGHSIITAGDGTPPTIDNIIIKSNNPNAIANVLPDSLPAKVGDKVTVSFHASEPLDTTGTIVTINGVTATLTKLANDNYKAEAIMTPIGNRRKWQIPFTIDFEDEFGNDGDPTVIPGGAFDDETLIEGTDGSKVFFDEVAPNIAIVNDLLQDDEIAGYGDPIDIDFSHMPTDYYEGYEVWIAPIGTTIFDASTPNATHIAQPVGSGTLKAPNAKGIYKCYLLDLAGNPTTQSDHSIYVGDIFIVDINKGPDYDFETIQEAINSSQVKDGDIVQIRDGVYNENVDFKGKAVSFYSESEDPTKVIVEGVGQNSVFTMEDIDKPVVIRAITLRNGKGKITTVDGACHSFVGCHGGGLFCQRVTDLVIQDVMIRNNVASSHGSVGGSGGGIYCNETNLQLSGVTISNNTAELYRGGGVCAENSNITIQGSEVIHNTAGNYGGAFALWRSNLTINNGVGINHNSVTGPNASGGAIYQIYSKIIGTSAHSGNTSSRPNSGNYIYRFDEGTDPDPVVVN